mgnify:CR=1 FL=1
MSTCRSTSGKASRRTILKATVAAGAGMTLITPFGRIASAQDSYNIAFIQGVIGDNFYITMDCGAQAKAAALGNVTVDTQGPERFDQTLQTPILNAVVQSKPDAIMMAPYDMSAIGEPPASGYVSPRITPMHFAITADKIERLRSKALLYHPLPRFDEIDPSCDHLPNAMYFEQVRLSKFMRMAVLERLLRAN